MAKVRVHELATELGIESRVVMQELKRLGEFVRGPSSSLEAPVARRVAASLGLQRLQTDRQSNLVTEQDTSTASFDSTTPSARQHGWQAGAVPEPRHADLLDNVRRVKQRFPVLGDHIDALQRLGSQVVFASMCKREGFRDCATVHVRFSGAIEAGFGFTREVLIFYSPHDDFQGRTFEAAAKEAAESSRSVTPDTFLIWSPDRNLRVKLQDWSRPSKLAVPLLLEDAEDPLALITVLRNYIYARDLFYITTPVSGASFFGRRTLLQSLRADVLSQRVTGVFGLRKSGKTSILLQLITELKNDSIVPVLVDLEKFSSPPEDPTDEILSDLRRRIMRELKSHGLRTKELAELPEIPGILALTNALQDILAHIGREGHRVVLLLDEIEYLTPADRIDIAEGNMPRVAQLLSALRSLVQETENFTFVLSGLTSAIVEAGRLYGRPNPLFSWAKAEYVQPLARAEADDLASTVGQKMGIQIEPGALEALHEASGGHAYLYRNLSSAVVRTLPVDVFQRRINRAAVLLELKEWKSEVQGNVDEMVQHVKRYYPTEAVMLELLREEPESFAELADEEHVAVRRLLDLGLIVRAGAVYQPNVILDLA